MSFNVKILRAGITLPNGTTYYTSGQIVTLTDAQFDLIAPGAFSYGYVQNLGQVSGNGSGGTTTPSTPSTPSSGDATTSVKGIAKILGGTADAPTVPWSAITAAPTIPSDATLVHKTGDETVAGIKTFSSSPLVPTATSANQAANLGNITSAIAALGGGGGSVTDATTTAKGVARILGGTADAPTVPYASVTGKPTLATVATSGAYGDLTGRPTIPSAKADVGLGNVDNTSDANKPISTATQTALSAKADDSAVVHKAGGDTVSGTITFSSSPVVPTATAANQAANLGNINSAVAASGGAVDATTTVKGVAKILGGSADAPTVPYASVTGKPTIPATAGDVGAQPANTNLTTIAALDSATAGMLSTDGSGWIRKSYAQVRTALGLATVATSGAYTDLTGRPTLATVATSGAYTDLTGRPTLPSTVADDALVMHLAGAETVTGIKSYSVSPVVPTPTTSGQAAPKGYVDTAIANLVNSAPGTLDTLGEIAAQLATDESATAALTTAVGARALSSRLISTGNGLSGGGDLTTDRTLSVLYGSTANTAVQGNDARVTADQAASTASIRTLGTGALQAASGADTRLVNAVQVGGDLLPEYLAGVAQTAAITSLDMVGKITRYSTTGGAVSQVLPPAVAGRVLGIGWDSGTAALTLSGATSARTSGTTSGSATVTDTSITSADQGRAVSGTGIPAGAYVGTVTPGTSYLLTSSLTAQTNVNATVTNASAALTLTDLIGSATTDTPKFSGEVFTLHAVSGNRWRAVSGNKPTTALDLMYVKAAGSNTGTLATSATQFYSYLIPDDGSATAGWPNRWEFRFASTGNAEHATGYGNEYGELRSVAAKQTTVALRAKGHPDGSTTNIFMVTDFAQTPTTGTYFAVSPTATIVGTPLSITGAVAVTGALSATGAVTATNIGVKVTTSSSAPSSPATGDIWIDTSP